MISLALKIFCCLSANHNPEFEWVICTALLSANQKSNFFPLVEIFTPRCFGREKNSYLNWDMKLKLNVKKQEHRSHVLLSIKLSSLIQVKIMFSREAKIHLADYWF